jgi:hypothetical protein
MKPKRGDYVTIYEDPITCLRPEGKATIMSVGSEHNGMWRCKVRFNGDEFTVERVIKDTEYV